MYYTRTYKRWAGMLQRCTNENRPDYNYYGNRGIRVCDKWLNFKGFYEDMGDCPEKLTLDRIDTNGNYCKENCRWADRKTQSRNTRKNRIITFNGQTKCVSEWAEITGIKYITLIDRLERNWPNQKLLIK